MDARRVAPVWLSVPSSVVELAVEDTFHRSSTFSLWRVPARQALIHDGRSIHIQVECGRHPIQLTIPPDLGDGVQFSFRIVSGALGRLNWLAARRADQILAGSIRERPRSAVFRPSRAAVMHLRMIQALDGRTAGASHRDIAEVVFGKRAVHRDWSADSELRARMRYLVRRSTELASSGYRSLAGLKDNPGDFGRSPDSP
jgi:hypothetical protein